MTTETNDEKLAKLKSEQNILLNDLHNILKNIGIEGGGIIHNLTCYLFVYMNGEELKKVLIICDIKKDDEILDEEPYIIKFDIALDKLSVEYGKKYKKMDLNWILELKSFLIKPTGNLLELYQKLRILKGLYNEEDDYEDELKEKMEKMKLSSGIFN